MISRHIQFQIALLLCADALPVDSSTRSTLIDKTTTEWLSYHRHAWDDTDQRWYAITTSGRRLPYKELEKIRGYYSKGKLEPHPTNGMALWLATLAHRLRPTPCHSINRRDTVRRPRSWRDHRQGRYPRISDNKR